MGNCMLKRLGVVEEMIKVVTPDGGLMELYAPMKAGCITNEFPGYGIFDSQYHHLSPPLLHHQNLSAGKYYHLLPLHSSRAAAASTHDRVAYRMSESHHDEVFNRSSGSTSAGVWKVRLVIKTDHLSAILSQEARTEALIESVRTLAKCGGRAEHPLSVL